MVSLDLHSLICSCRLKFFSAGCKVGRMMALIWCYSIQLKQPYYTWLQNPNGAHTMPIFIFKIFPLHGTFHPFSSPENHLLILRPHLEWYPSTHIPGLSLLRLWVLSGYRATLWSPSRSRAPWRQGPQCPHCWIASTKHGWCSFLSGQKKASANTGVCPGIWMHGAE